MIDRTIHCDATGCSESSRGWNPLWYSLDRPDEDEPMKVYSHLELAADFHLCSQSCLLKQISLWLLPLTPTPTPTEDSDEDLR
jgi:hypothetical protein